MQVRILSVFLLLSSSLLFSSVVCDPNHHHNHHNEHYTSESTVEMMNSETPIVAQNEHYASESSVEVLKSETKDGSETPVVAQNGTTIEVTSSNSSDEGSGLGYKVGVPIVSILFIIGILYCVCKCCHACIEVCCCGCCEEETPRVVVMQSNTVRTQQPTPPAPQIILQQPIIHQHAPTTYVAQQRWAKPPPQWSQPPTGPPQWAPQSMGQQQQYSPSSGYDNAGYVHATAPPPYNTGKY